MLSRIEEICNQIAILNHGRLVCEGSLNDLLQSENSQSFTIEGLNDVGRMKMEGLIAEQGATITHSENTRMSLDKFFLKKVGRDGDE